MKIPDTSIKYKERNMIKDRRVTHGGDRNCK